MKAFTSLVALAAACTTWTLHGGVISGPVVNSANGHAYYLLSRTNWTGAEAEAVALGGHLVTINDADENAWVHETFSVGNGCVWLGLRRPPDASFRWANGEMVFYANWAAGEPNDGPGTGEHVVMYAENTEYGPARTWNDGPDSFLAHFGVPDPFGVVEVGPPTTFGCTPGTVVAWGGNDHHQVNPPTDLTNVVAIAAGGDHSLALRGDGTVIAWGSNTDGQTEVPPSLADVKAISAGAYHSAALKRDGTVVAWGQNTFGQVNVPQGLTGVVAIACGYYHTLALQNGGKVIGWGRNLEGQCEAPVSCANLVAIAAGGYHSMGLRPDRTVVLWGFEKDHQVEPPAGLTSVANVACGYDHALALREDGTVTAWAFSDFGSRYDQLRIPAGLTNVAVVAAGVTHNLALRADGTVLAWGENQFGQSTPAWGLSNVVSLAAGNRHSLGLIGDGRPAVVVQPVDCVGFTGATAELAVVVMGAAPIRFQWRLGGVDIPGATNELLTMAEVQFSKAGHYSVVVSNSSGTATSREALLTVVDSPPFIVRQPAGANAVVGGSVTFEVAADGSRPLWYQWRFAGTAIPGATNATFTLSNVQPADAGDYTVTIANAFGTVTSELAAVEVPTGPGSLDLTFDLTIQGSLPGIECDSYPPSLSGLALQPDGKVIIGGTFDRINGVPRGGVARLNADGKLDSSFEPPWSSRLDVSALALQPDHKLLILGRASEGHPYGGLVRLNADGSLDPGFTNYWSEQWVPHVHCLALQTDGKILVGGEFMQPRTGLARFNSDGTLDETFTPPFMEAFDGAAVESIALQPDGKVLVLGPWQPGLFRFNSDGSKDPSFMPASNLVGRVTAILPQADGRVLIGLSGCCGRCATVARLHPDGSMDDSFASVGLGTVPLTLALQPDGRILVGGGPAGYENDDENDIGVYRLHPDGRLDTTFRARLDAWVGLPAVEAMVIQLDGQILVGGYFTSVNGIPAVDMARLDGDPAAAPFVHRDVVRDYYLPGEPLAVQLVAVPTPTGSVYSIEDRPPAGWAVTRISHDGVFDPGACTVRFGPFNDAEPRVLSYEVTPPAHATGRISFTGNGSFADEGVATGGARSLEQGCRLAIASRVSQGQIHLTLTGQPGVRFLIEASSDLWDWTPFVTVTNTLGQVSFTDALSGSDKQRFYRTKRLK